MEFVSLISSGNMFIVSFRRRGDFILKNSWVKFILQYLSNFHWLIFISENNFSTLYLHSLVITNLFSLATEVYHVQLLFCQICNNGAQFHANIQYTLLTRRMAVNIFFLQFLYRIQCHRLVICSTFSAKNKLFFIEIKNAVKIFFFTY